jgi:hypothetical protein
MIKCRRINVTARIRAEESDVAQLFYKIPGQSKFTETASRIAPFEYNTQPIELLFNLDSPHGFTDEFRFDPVTKSQKIGLLSLDVKCRIRTFPK